MRVANLSSIVWGAVLMVGCIGVHAASTDAAVQKKSPPAIAGQAQKSPVGVFKVREGENTSIEFGNGESGRRPPPNGNSADATYRTGEGARGNITSGTPRQGTDSAEENPPKRKNSPRRGGKIPPP